MEAAKRNKAKNEGTKSDYFNRTNSDSEIDENEIQKEKSKNPGKGKVSPPKRSRLSETAVKEAAKRKKSNCRATKSDYFNCTNSDSDSDESDAEKGKPKNPGKGKVS